MNNQIIPGFFAGKVDITFIYLLSLNPHLKWNLELTKIVCQMMYIENQ